MRLASVRTYSLQFPDVTGLLADFLTNMLGIPTYVSIGDVWNGFRLHPIEPRGAFVSASLGVREGKQLGWGLLTLLPEEQPAFVAVVGLHRSPLQGNEAHTPCAIWAAERRLLYMNRSS